MCVGSVLRVACMVGSGLCMCGSQTTRLMKKDVKMGYGLLVLFYSALLMLILYFGSKYLHFAKLFVNCPDGASLDSCLGLAVVYRLSFVLAVFHFLVGLCCLTRDGFAKIVNEGLWGVKMLIVLGGVAASLFISNDFFIPYAKASLYLSAIFLFVQAVSLIDAFYLWADFWREKFDNGNNCYGCLLIFTSLLMYAAGTFFVIQGFKNFWVAGCTGSKILILMAIILSVAFVVLIILKFHPTGSIITSGAITIFGVFLFWSALVSNPSQTCNPVYDSKTSMLLQIAFSFAFAFSCNIYWALVTQKSTAYEAAQLPQVSSSEGDEEIDKKIEQEQKDAKADGGQTNLIKTDGKEQEFIEYENNSYIKFHGFMVLFSIYICAVFTNWGHASINSSTWNYEGSHTDGPYYIKIAIGIFTFGLYLWTIVAPTLFPDRDFVNPN